MPKVIDLPTATTLDSTDYLIMEESSGGTKKITKANALSEIGAGVTASSTLTSISSNTYTNLCQLTLTPGTWIITAEARWQMPESGKTMLASISTASATVQNGLGGFGQLESSYANGYMGMNLVRIWSPSANTTMYLVGYQTCSSAATVQTGQCYMRAIRIK